MLFKLFLLSFVFITFGFFSTARAATFTVTKFVDVADDNACTSNCSLREAIIAANANGKGIRNVVVSMSDLSGNVKTATTNALGYYKFTDVEIGQTYIFTASAKHLKFQQPSQVLNVNNELNDINFVGIGSREF